MGGGQVEMMVPGHKVGLIIGTAEATSAAATSTRVTTLPARDDSIDHGLSLGNGWWWPCQSAHPLRQATRLLSHLDLAATVSLQPGDLLSAAPDDHPHHLVGHHHLLAGHPPSSHAPVHVGERCTGEGALRVTGPSAATSGEVVVVVKGTLQASSSSVVRVARWLDFRSNLLGTNKGSGKRLTLVSVLWTSSLRKFAHAAYSPGSHAALISRLLAATLATRPQWRRCEHKRARLSLKKCYQA